jgi:hypothetical protein
MSAFIQACECCRTLWGKIWDDRARLIVADIAAGRGTAGRGTDRQDGFPLALSSTGWAARTVNLPLEKWIDQFVEDPSMQLWWVEARPAAEAYLLAEGIPAGAAVQNAEKARKAFLTHKFFELSGPDTEAIVMQILAARADRAFSHQVASTIELGALLHDFWVVPGWWLFRSLAAGRYMPLWSVMIGADDEAAEDGEGDDLDVTETEDDGSPEDDAQGAANDAEGEAAKAGLADMPPKPLWWDRDYSLDTFMRFFLLGQAAKARHTLFHRRADASVFWSNAFVYSPVGRLLRLEGLAVRIYAAVHVTASCRVCGHRHVYLRNHGCPCAHCRELEPWLERRPWLLAAADLTDMSQVRRWVCVKCRRVQTTDPEVLCSSCHGRLRLRLVPGQASREMVRWVCPVCERVKPGIPETECVAGKHPALPQLLWIVGPPENLAQVPIQIPNTVSPPPTIPKEILQLLKEFCSIQLARLSVRVQTPGRSNHQTGALNTLLVLASLFPGAIVDVICDMSRLPQGWEKRFWLNLHGIADRDQALARIKGARTPVCDCLKVNPAPLQSTITPDNYGVIKHRIKQSWKRYHDSHQR